MGEKPAASDNGAQVLLVLLLIAGVLVLMSGKFTKKEGKTSRTETTVVDPSVRKYIGDISRKDTLEERDRKELQQLLDKVGK